ncbi:hypothetical protein ABZS66_12285 [Dactylosporangium sp. NPDC005572]|uniref:hypothetical protein n=1 Tax=Dactylosporangium sp. NPDC005572 TaxID=3156889 RepID=UPI0033B42F17
MPTLVPPFVSLSTIDELLTLHFPLLPRTRPTCRALQDRIAHVEDVLRQAQQPATDTLLRAAEAHDFAALIASDCGMPDLARDLCLRQHAVIHTATPVGVAHAKLTLQPLINLARLHIRAGDGTAAYQLLHGLFQAVQSRASTVVDDVRFDGAHLVNDTDHAELTQWLWTILLADGTRALARAGRWDEATQHAEQHHGIGTRLFDGRQVAIIAAHTQTALAMLHAADTPTPWERAIAACLATVCSIRLQQDTDAAVSAMIAAYHAAASDTTDRVFQTRLPLTVTAYAAGHAGAVPLVTQVLRLAQDTADAYITRDILAAAHLIPLTGSSIDSLTGIVRRAGLGTGTVLPLLLDRLLNATEHAERLISTAAGSAT